MKKVLAAALLLVIAVTALVSCSSSSSGYTFEEYEEKMRRGGGSGFSNTSIDRAEHLLPSRKFISEYTYTDGGYHLARPRGKFLSKPFLNEKVILWLKYEEAEYQKAKAFMLEKIPIKEDRMYLYGDYVFYLNYEKKLPIKFTMACYNDTNHTLIFLGACGSGLKENNAVVFGNWKGFIDTYFGEYYDFSK